MPLEPTLLHGRFQGQPVLVVPLDAEWCLIAGDHQPSGAVGPVSMVKREDVTIDDTATD